MNAYRKIIVFVAGCSLSALQMGCQQQAKVAETPAAAPAPEAKRAEAAAELGGPKIEFESLVYDFGKVGPGQKMQGQFKLTNAGDAPLKISGVDKCCGAVTKLDKQELPPGQSTLLHVQYTSSVVPGPMTKRLYVNSNDKATPKASLTIKAETVLRVTYEPKSLKLMIKQENAGCPKITLTSTDNTPFSITSFKATNDALTANIDSAVQATQFVLEPKADLTRLRRTPAGRISIGMTYTQPGARPETATIAFQALSRFSIRPTSLVLLYDQPGQRIEKSLVINNNYGEDFEIESASSKEGYVKVLGQNKVANGYQLSLEITTPAGKRFTDTLTITLKDGEKLGVVCRGIYKASTAKPKPAEQ